MSSTSSLRLHRVRPRPGRGEEKTEPEKQQLHLHRLHLDSKSLPILGPRDPKVKIGRDAVFNKHHRLDHAPEDDHAPQNINPACKTIHHDDGTESHQDPPGARHTSAVEFPEAESGTGEEQPTLRRSLHGRIPRKEWPVLPTRSRTHADGLYIPSSYEDAISCPDADKWKAAIEEEYQSLLKTRPGQSSLAPRKERLSSLAEPLTSNRRWVKARRGRKPDLWRKALVTAQELTSRRPTLQPLHTPHGNGHLRCGGC